MSATILKFPVRAQYEVSVEKVTHEHPDGSRSVSIEVGRAPLGADWYDFYGPFDDAEQAQDFANVLVRANPDHRLVGAAS